MIVENKPGAQSIIAAELVARSRRPTATRCSMGPSGPMTINPRPTRSCPYSPLRDFAPISMIGSFPLIVWLNPQLPVRSVRELIDYAKANPGKRELRLERRHLPDRHRAVQAADRHASSR